ncbi:MAG: hypothetical protein ACE5J0_00340 [Candidatus Paceibacterales bacterium]
MLKIITTEKVAILKDDEILLTSKEDSPECWDFPAGHIEIDDLASKPSKKLDSSELPLGVLINLFRLGDGKVRLLGGFKAKWVTRRQAGKFNLEPSCDQALDRLHEMELF